MGTGKGTVDQGAVGLTTTTGRVDSSAGEIRAFTRRPFPTVVAIWRRSSIVLVMGLVDFRRAQVVPSLSNVTLRTDGRSSHSRVASGLRISSGRSFTCTGIGFSGVRWITLGGDA